MKRNQKLLKQVEFQCDLLYHGNYSIQLYLQLMESRNLMLEKILQLKLSNLNQLLMMKAMIYLMYRSQRLLMTIVFQCDLHDQDKMLMMK